MFIQSLLALLLCISVFAEPRVSLRAEKGVEMNALKTRSKLYLENRARSATSNNSDLAAKLEQLEEQLQLTFVQINLRSTSLQIEKIQAASSQIQIDLLDSKEFKRQLFENDTETELRHLRIAAKKEEKRKHQQAVKNHEKALDQYQAEARQIFNEIVQVTETAIAESKGPKEIPNSNAKRDVAKQKNIAPSAK